MPYISSVPLLSVLDDDHCAITMEQILALDSTSQHDYVTALVQTPAQLSQLQERASSTSKELARILKKDLHSLFESPTQRVENDRSKICSHASRFADYVRKLLSSISAQLGEFCNKKHAQRRAKHATAYLDTYSMKCGWKAIWIHSIRCLIRNLDLGMGISPRDIFLLERVDRILAYFEEKEDERDSRIPSDNVYLEDSERIAGYVSVSKAELGVLEQNSRVVQAHEIALYLISRLKRKCDAHPYLHSFRSRFCFLNNLINNVSSRVDIMEGLRLKQREEAEKACFGMEAHSQTMTQSQRTRVIKECIERLQGYRDHGFWTRALEDIESAISASEHIEDQIIDQTRRCNESAVVLQTTWRRREAAKQAAKLRSSMPPMLPTSPLAAAAPSPAAASPGVATLPPTVATSSPFVVPPPVFSGASSPSRAAPTLRPLSLGKTSEAAKKRAWRQRRRNQPERRRNQPGGGEAPQPATQAHPVQTRGPVHNPPLVDWTESEELWEILRRHVPAAREGPFSDRLYQRAVEQRRKRQTPVPQHQLPNGLKNLVVFHVTFSKTINVSIFYRMVESGNAPSPQERVLRVVGVGSHNGRGNTTYSVTFYSEGKLRHRRVQL